MSFAFWRRDESEPSADFSLFGKLPHRADFIRINASSQVACEYDQLLATALDQLSRNPGWESGYDATRHAFFAYRSNDHKAWFIGCQCPSWDSGGRRFPLVGGLTLDGSALRQAITTTPLACEVFLGGLLDNLHSAIESSVDALGCRAFLQDTVDVINQTGADFDLGRQLLDQYAANHQCGELQYLLHAAYPHAHLAQALINITFYANFIRNFPSTLTAQEIVLPIPTCNSDGSVAASLWLELVARLIGSPQRITGFYFRDDFIVIAIDAFSVGFSPLLPLTSSVKLRGVMLSAEHDTWAAHPLYAEIDYVLHCLLADPAVTIRALLDCAAQIGRRIHLSP